MNHLVNVAKFEIQQQIEITLMNTFLKTPGVRLHWYGSGCTNLSPASSDVAIKVFGNDFDILGAAAARIGEVLEKDPVRVKSR